MEASVLYFLELGYDSEPRDELIMEMANEYGLNCMGENDDNRDDDDEDGGDATTPPTIVPPPIPAPPASSPEVVIIEEEENPMEMVPE
jgi:hypothetical protein